MNLASTRNPTRHAALAALPIAALIVVGCGTPTPTGAVAGPNPCTLVLDTEAATVLGSSTTRTGPVTANRGTSCTWTTADGALLGLTVFTGAEFFVASKRQLPDARAITGIGSEAFVSDEVAGSRSGDTVIYLDTVGPGSPSLESTLRAATARI